MSKSSAGRLECWDGSHLIAGLTLSKDSLTLTSGPLLRRLEGQGCRPEGLKVGSPCSWASTQCGSCWATELLWWWLCLWPRPRSHTVSFLPPSVGYKWITSPPRLKGRIRLHLFIGEWSDQKSRWNRRYYCDHLWKTPPTKHFKNCPLFMIKICLQNQPLFFLKCLSAYLFQMYFFLVAA